jgi:D-serine deaminase-like pyridoxal phosphate-dependent protein
MDLTAMETPCLILDRGKLDRNIATMALQLADRGVTLRPHGKTAKSIDVVRRALGPGHGITVSTLKEADYFFAHGISDLLYAVGIAPVKLDHAANLIRRGARLTLVLDSMEQAQAAAAKGREHSVDFPVLIEIDSDGQRSGLVPEDPRLVAIGQRLQTQAGVTLQGVLTHAGGAYACGSVEAIRAMSTRERQAAVAAAAALRAAGLPCPVVSIGSTPTARFAVDLSGVTEVRAGVYMFQDLVMAGLGVCPLEDIALSVLASVIGHQPAKGWVIVDGGWMALSRDRGLADQHRDEGYGRVCGLDGTPVADLIVRSLTQEHGVIAQRGGPVPLPATLPIGSAVRILPHHACATAAMHDRYVVVDGTTEVVDIWPRINGW